MWYWPRIVDIARLFICDYLLWICIQKLLKPAQGVAMPLLSLVPPHTVLPLMSTPTPPADLAAKPPLTPLLLRNWPRNWLMCATSPRSPSTTASTARTSSRAETNTRPWNRSGVATPSRGSTSSSAYKRNKQNEATKKEKKKSPPPLRLVSTHHSSAETETETLQRRAAGASLADEAFRCCVAVCKGLCRNLLKTRCQNLSS